MKIRRALVVAATLAASASLLAPPATAAAPPPEQAIELTASAEAIVRDFLTDNAVDAATQDALITKYESGVMWDSLTEAEPVSVLDTTNPLTAEETTTARFADGSVQVTTRQVPKAKAGTGTNAPSLSCPRSGTGSWVGCRVDMNQGVLRLYFYADYRLGSSARISNAYGTAGWNAGGSFSPSDPNIVRSVAQESPYAPAYAYAAATYQAGLFGATVKVHLYAYRGNAWTADS